MTRTELHPLELAAVAAMALGWALWTVARLLLVPALALLLTLAGWRPAPRSAAPQPQPVAPAAAEPLPPAPAVLLACAPEPVAIAAPPLEGLTVAQLRKLARAAGLPRSLSHAGRRAQLLAALAPG